MLTRYPLPPALHKAVEKGDGDITDALLQAGADVTLEDGKGRTAAQIALEKGMDADILAKFEPEFVIIDAGTSHHFHLDSGINKSALAEARDATLDQDGDRGWQANLRRLLKTLHIPQAMPQPLADDFMKGAEQVRARA